MAARPHVLAVDNPFTGQTVCELPFASEHEAHSSVTRAKAAQRAWAETSLDERIALVGRFCEAMAAMKDEVARDITNQMGKPLGQAKGEVDTMVKRATYMASVAKEALADSPIPEAENFHRRVVREPVGVVFVIAPWNYPLLTAVNTVVPAVLAGNAVILKHSPRTPLCGEHFARAFQKAGAPKDLVQAVMVDHPTAAQIIARPEVGFVAFTGSVRGGHEVFAETAKRFIDTGLELGGKDPGYVAADADFDHAVENLVDGAFYNAGQSCCGIERIYVHASLYDRFVEKAAELVRGYRMGDPLDEKTNMGPMALPDAPQFLAKQVREAKEQGGRVLCGGMTAQVNGGGRFFAPCVVADAPQSSSLMQEESFGPVVGIARVSDDEEAVRLMNDSRYGLTCAIWTADEGRAERMARKLETGTVFMNRCDYLDPALPWTGVKDSGKGVTLSKWGFNGVTRLKSIHFRLKTR